MAAKRHEAWLLEKHGAKALSTESLNKMPAAATEEYMHALEQLGDKSNDPQAVEALTAQYVAQRNAGLHIQADVKGTEKTIGQPVLDAIEMMGTVGVTEGLAALDGPALRAGLRSNREPAALIPNGEAGEPAPSVVPEAPAQPAEAAPTYAPKPPVRPVLPAFDGENTHGILITNEGDEVSFTNGNTDPVYVNYANAEHVEGKAALYIRAGNSTGGVLFHNNINGTCSYCDTMTKTLLPEGAQLDVYPPENAVAKQRGAKASPTSYKGNNKTPKPNKRLDFIARSEKFRRNLLGTSMFHQKYRFSISRLRRTAYTYVL